jgi:hypothetical protein
VFLNPDGYSNSHSNTRLRTCYQVPTLKNFPASAAENSAAEEKIQVRSKFTFLKAFVVVKKSFVYVSVWTYLEFLEKRRKKQTFQKFGPFSALSEQNRPKFGGAFVWPLYFLFGPF